ncbi:MAG TPA: adenylate/guanylate cyclase domain-containing protein, partial [Verrucomicrobiae bacterium]|nr:adenylate/guanylate cyclase domain-containing protein [Verrucomicrobiae bacterium]
GSFSQMEIAHVLFMDIVSYSKLPIDQQSELLGQLNQIVRGTEQFKAAEAAGKLVRLPTGDGMALAFLTSVDAPVRCALEVAEALKNRPHIRLRMGVDSGPVDLIMDVNDRPNVAGAGINMAQRVMDCGDAGHILLSKRVAGDLAQYSKWQPHLQDLGEAEVKHGVIVSLVNLFTESVGNPAVPEKVQRAKRHALLVERKKRNRALGIGAVALLVVLAAGGIWWWSKRPPAPESPAKTAAGEDGSRKGATASLPAKSIAVLPLENLSDDKENAFFADGIQDDLLTSLMKIKDLKVISRTSVMGYRNKSARNLRQIGKELGVASVLEGSVRRSGNRVLVNVQLIDTATDQHLWAERYDRTLTDSISLQGELASEIAGALRSTLTAEEKARVETKPTDNPDAYVAYLRGREFQLRPETARENLLSAESFYKEAIALDPKFVLARARLSLVQALIYEYFEQTNSVRLAEARKHAEEALRLDPNCAEAHSSLARCAQNVNDAATTRRELDTAVRLAPNDASVIVTAAVTQWGMGWNDEAVANFKRATELGPREPRNFYSYGVLLKELDRKEEARAALDTALLLAPESVYFRLQRAAAEISWTGDTQRARAILAKLPPGQDPDGRVTSAFCTLAIYERNFPEALRLLQAYAGETLPMVDSGGFGAQDTKIFSEAMIRLYAGDYPRAYECFDSERGKAEAEVAINPQSANHHSGLALLYAQMRWTAPALAEAARAVQLGPPADPFAKVWFHFNLARAYTWAGETDLALKQIEIFLTLPWDYKVNNFRLDPAWDPIRKDPRFQRLLETRKL